MYRRNVKLLSIFNFLIGASFFAPLAIIYFTHISGSFTLGASIFSITMLASAIFEVPTGIWSDKVGRRNTIILGSWTRVLAFIFYALGFSYWWLVVGGILEGLSRAFYSGNNDAFLYDTLSDDGLESQYDEHLGKISSNEQLALGLAALAGGIFASISFPLLLWLSVITQIALLVISYLLVEPKSRKASEPNIFAHFWEALKLFIHNKKLRMLSLASIIGYACGEAGYQFRTAFVNTLWPLWAIGFSNVLSNFGATISYYFSGKLIKKFSAIKLLVAGSIYGKIINLVAYVFPSTFSPILLTTTSLFFGVNDVAGSTLRQREFTSRQRATMASLNSLFGDIGFAIVSVGLGAFADLLGPARALVILTVLSVPNIFLYINVFKRDKKI